MDFCFVILHYLTDQDTISCIESIENLIGGTQAHIIIVDNFSNNGSIERVQAAIKDYENCKILYNDRNMGFAKGNNVGYEYAINHYKNAMVIILNNDTFIEQKDFIIKIEKAYECNQYAVLGPDIISMIDGGHQNPLGIIPTKKAVKKDIWYYSILLLLSKMHLYDFLKKKIRRNTNRKQIRKEKPESNNIQGQALHGSCLIFSPVFTIQMKNAFDNETFLYKEEYILAKRCEEKKFKMLYDANIEIYHKEDSSTNEIVSTIKEKREFQFRNLIQSSKVLLKYL